MEGELGFKGGEGREVIGGKGTQMGHIRKDTWRRRR